MTRCTTYLEYKIYQRRTYRDNAMILPWILSSESLLTSYSLMASSSSICDDIVHGSPERDNTRVSHCKLYRYPNWPGDSGEVRTRRKIQFQNRSSLFCTGWTFIRLRCWNGDPPPPTITTTPPFFICLLLLFVSWWILRLANWSVSAWLYTACSVNPFNTKQQHPVHFIKC